MALGAFRIAPQGMDELDFLGKDLAFWELQNFIRLRGVIFVARFKKNMRHKELIAE